MRIKWIILIAALQIAVLGFMAGQREWVVHTGRVVFLRTAPVDPRDAMRGDYVRLSYDISQVTRSLWRGRLAQMDVSTLRPDTVVYASLNLTNGPVAELTGLDLDPPSDGCFLRGRTERRWGGNSSDSIRVRYGIEAYFTQQGRALAIEQSRFGPNGVSIPLEMEVAVSPGGLAVLKGTRHSVLGIAMEFEFNGHATSSNRHTPSGAVISLVNLSSNSVAVVDSRQALALVFDQRWSRDVRWDWKPASAPDGLNVILLAPGQAHAIPVSFADPFWSVVRIEKDQTRGPMTLEDVDEDWTARFRFEYRPPEASQCATLPNASLIWHGRLSTSTFDPSRPD
jgi:uncharacterized membrane-anchored protein